MPGAVLLDTLLDALGVTELTLCEWSLREGILLDFIHSHPRTVAQAEAVPDVAETAHAAARTVAVARGASVRVQAGAPAEVQASPTMLRQAIENLIDNAAAYGGAGGVEVDVRADPAAGQVEVVVADRGDGADDAASGHGIGLFVVRRFLDEAGGRSWVAPREGGGTMVGLRLPLRAEAEPDPLDMAVNT